MRADAFYLLTLSKINTILRIAGRDLNRRILIDQITIDYRSTVGVAINRITEDLHRMQSGRGGQRDLYCIKMVEDTTIGRNIIKLAAELQLTFGLLFIENVATVCFVHDDTIVTANRHRFIRLQGAFNQRLNSGNVNFSAVFRKFIRQPFNIKDAVKGVAVNTRIVKCTKCLLTERTAINQEENALKTLRLDKAEHQGDRGTGFTGTGGHRQQDLLLSIDDSIFDCPHGIFLIVAQAQFTHSWIFSKPLILSLRIAAEHI